jgi:colanic acid/amylovoran biosynthesis glycosyltransferase
MLRKYEAPECGLFGEPVNDGEAVKPDMTVERAVLPNTSEFGTDSMLRVSSTENPVLQASINYSAGVRTVALQRYSQFVGRTTNWLYDHLRFVPRHNPIVLCDALLNRDEFPELEVWCLHWSFARRVWRRITDNRYYPSEQQKLKRLAPCVVHSHFGGDAVYDYKLHRNLDVPWVVSFYGADVYERSEAKHERYAHLFEEATRVLALGPVMKKQLAQLGCPEKKIDIHPLGVDVGNLPAKPRILKRGELLKILFAGTFREKKGIQYLIEAAFLARRVGVRLQLELVGDSAGKRGDEETKEAVLRQINRLDLQDVVNLHGYLQFRELVDLALRSHVFVVPSVTAATGDAEGTPFVLQQMMATGMSAIATVHSDIPYLFGEHKHLLVGERDARAIADRLQRYADDPETLVVDGVVLRDQVRRAFDVRVCAAHLSDLYVEIATQ